MLAVVSLRVLTVCCGSLSLVGCCRRRRRREQQRWQNRTRCIQ